MILLELFITFLKIGAFTFGGGYAMLPLIEEEVIRHNWMSLTELVDFIAVSEGTPGPFAINVATYIGTTVGGLPGALCATIGVVIPSFVIILLVAQVISKFKKSALVSGIMSGLKPAVVGLIATSLLSVSTTALFPEGFSYSYLTSLPFIGSIIILALCLFLSFKKIHPIIIIIISAVLGICAGYLGI